MPIRLALDAVDAIYETPGQPGHWAVALEQMATVFDAVGAVLIAQSDDGTISTVVSPALADAQRDYQNGWWKQDFLTARVLEKRYVVPGNVIHEWDMATAEEIASHPFYVDFRHKHGLGTMMAGAISPRPSTAVFLSVQRSLGAPNFTLGDGELLEHFLKHCERALLLSCTIDQLHDLEATLLEALSRTGCGVLLLDKGGLVASGNEAGRKLLGADLRIVGGRITVADASARKELDAAVVSSLRSCPEDRLACPRPVIIPRAGAGHPLIAYVLPLRSDRAARFWSPAPEIAAMVILLDRSPGAELDPALVRDYLGLTLGEARVASQVGVGRSPRSAAEMLGISEETVRTTIKRIFSKTGATRQSELAALIADLRLLDFGTRGS